MHFPVLETTPPSPPYAAALQKRHKTKTYCKFLRGVKVFQNLWESDTLSSCEICGLSDSSTLGGEQEESKKAEGIKESLYTFKFNE